MYYTFSKSSFDTPSDKISSDELSTINVKCHHYHNDNNTCQFCYDITEMTTTQEIKYAST
jgi:hypothetical protein